MDTDTVLASVARTGRLLMVHEAVGFGGVGAELVAAVAEHGWHDLKSPPRRLAPTRRVYPPADDEKNYLIGVPRHRESDRGDVQVSDQIDIRVPEFGHGLTEALVMEWRVSVGEVVKRGDVVAVLETDKSSVDLMAEKGRHRHGDRRRSAFDYYIGFGVVPTRAAMMKGHR